MRVVDKRQVYRELREFCLGFKNEYSKVSNVVAQYYLLSDILIEAKVRFGRRGRNKLVYTSDIMDVISKTFGVSNQTLYRACAAVKATRRGSTPPRYATRTYRNINNNLKNW